MGKTTLHPHMEVTETVLTFASGTVTLRKIGNIGFIQSTAAVSTSGGNYQNWFTMPEDFRPTTDRFIPVIYGGNASYPGLLKIQSGGVVQVYCNTSLSNQNIWISGPYVLN